LSRSGKRVLLKADIGMFYPTVYTHSIPWAIHGKTRAKNSKPKDNLLGDSLDRLVRNAQDRQTVGIPIGPDTSLLFAELILSRLDRRLRARGIHGSSVRFVDDLEIAFSSRSEAESALFLIQEFLAEYELSLNPLKTRIVELPDELEQMWAVRLKKNEIREDGTVQQNDLIDFFSGVFHESKGNPGKSVLNYGIRRLENTKIDARNWPLVEAFLFQCIVSEPGTLRTVVPILAKSVLQLEQLNLDKLKSSILFVIDQNIGHNHGSELSWALWCSLLFGIRIPDNTAERLTMLDDNFVALLTLHARERGLVYKGVNVSNWTDKMKQESLKNENWLLAYEANIKGWLPNKSGKDFVASHPEFSQLKAKRVSFYTTVQVDQFQFSYNYLQVFGNLPSDVADSTDNFEWLFVADSDYPLATD